MCQPRAVRKTWTTAARYIFATAVVLLLLIRASSASEKRVPGARRYFPARDLVAYIEYDGLDAHATAWEATAARELLVRTATGSLLSGIVRPLVEAWLKEDTGGLVTTADATIVGDLLVRKGFGCASYVNARQDCTNILVLKDFGRKENLDRLVHLWLAWSTPMEAGGAGQDAVRSVRQGRTIYQFPNEREGDGELDLITEDAPPGAALVPPSPAFLSAWFEGNDLILIFEYLDEEPGPGEKRAHAQLQEDHIAAVLDAIEGKEPDVTTHAGFISANAEGNDLKGFEADGLFFVGSPAGMDVLTWLSRIPSEEPEAIDAGHPDLESTRTAAADRTEIKKLGLDGISRVVGRWGFQDRALVTDVRVEAAAPRKGVIGLFDQPSFRTDRLPPMPDGVHSLVVGSLDLDGSYEKLMTVMRDYGPEGIKELEEFESLVKGCREKAGFRLREDILQPIGAQWCLFEIPAAKGRDTAGKKPGLTDHALVLSIKDADKIARLVDQLAHEFDPAATILDLFGSPETIKKRRSVLFPRIEPLAKPDRGYELILKRAPGDHSGRNLQPAILVDKSRVVLAGDLETARRVASSRNRRPDGWKPAAELAHALECLPRELTFLSVIDNTASPFPDRMADLPALVQRWVNSLDEPDLENASIWSVFDAFGAARPGKDHIRIERSKTPDPDQVRRHLFPSILAVATDDRGFRIIGREALPLVGLAGEMDVRYSWQARFGALLPHFAETFSVNFPRFEWDD